VIKEISSSFANYHSARRSSPSQDSVGSRLKIGSNERTFEGDRDQARDAQTEMQRKLPIGAELQPQGGVHFRVWAPESSSVSVELYSGGRISSVFPLHSESNGYFSGLIAEAKADSLYKLRLESGSFPDPVSRFQPEGPHGPSQIVDSSRFGWTDQNWMGRAVEDLVIYEMHIGTFTKDGTWRTAAEQLPELKDLGITMLEIMPLADFPGKFGWGYDGVDLFAPTRLYGTPDDLRAFINRAHELEMMVILDVVYNHIGPDGNYLKQFSQDYFTTKYSCEWGEALNFDGKNSDPVREFFTSNVRYWIEEFHFDGLRLDATQQIFDSSERHILADITTVARAAGRKRTIYIVGENEPQDTQLLRSCESGGFGLDAAWNDDYHHTAIVAATGKAEAYYSDYKGTPQEFISAIKHGFLYQGQWYKWQQKRRGTPALDLSPRKYVIFLQNHDQIANSLRGQRLHQITSPGKLKALTALTLLAPGTPMLFQGEEFAATSPFLFFADHNADLNRLVSKGRREFLHQFRTVACEECAGILAEPGDLATFNRCKLDFGDRERNRHIYKMHHDLLQLRKEDATIRNPDWIDGAVLGNDAFLLRYFSAEGMDRLLLVNLGIELYLNPAPEPLLAPPLNRGWRALWSTESPDYGGCGTPPLETQANWIILGHAAVLLKPNENSELPRVRLNQND
jgi:maltooligosyltrehalose trehalohydrolase